MCGIIGYVGPRQALPIILDGLKRLDYRGYDSSGVAIIDSTKGDSNAALFLHRGAGKLDAMASTISNVPSGTLGIGHTRWATHGKPTVANAHPHTDCSGDIAVVHNGIVENHQELRKELEAEGHTFRSQTDTEVIPHLVERAMAAEATLVEAVRQAVSRLQGAQAISVVSRRQPDTIVGVRIGHAGGLAVGYGQNELLLASDLPAMIAHVNSVSYLANREMAVICRDGVTFTTLDGAPLEKPRLAVQQDPVSAVKGQYRHFMLKEIMEQPEALISALRDRLDIANNRVTLPGFPFSEQQVKGFKRALLIGIGTSSNTALVGQAMIESLAGIPSQTENSSELRYREPLMDSDTLLISISQSGETVDTLAAMVAAKEHGVPQITVCNVPGSESTRIANYSLFINAGPEIAVASTKTLTGSMLCLYLLAIYLGQVRGTLEPPRVAKLLEEVARLPEMLGRIVARAPEYEALARRYFHSSNFMLLGRGINYPVALEGALKMKEISYIHAEGYQAGEMKHGPIALIDENMPVLALALQDRMHDKMIGNIEEVRARDGRVIAVLTEGDQSLAGKVADIITIPPVSELAAPILTMAPLQLLAYYIAVRRGCDVDQPRNLAKTVTVE